MSSQLSALQRRILDILRTEDLGFTLTGGGALAGFHLGHRRTDDLDLFFAGQVLDRRPEQVLQTLTAAGLQVDTLQRSPGFVRYRVSSEEDVVVVDLVADPVRRIELPVEVEAGLRVDTPHEILVNKLCALVSRAELRDLEDVRALVANGGDLDRALIDAPKKDGGFSPMTLAWLLPQLPLARSAELGFDEEALARFRDALVRRLTQD